MCVMEIGIFLDFVIAMRNPSRLSTLLETYASQCNPLAHNNKILPSHSA